MSTPIVFAASDQLFEQTLAFLESLRRNAPGVPLVCIPLADDLERIDILAQVYDFQYHDGFDIRAIENLGRIIYGDANRNLRKLACYTLEVEKFLMLDVGTIVLRDIAPWLAKPLDEFDLIFADSSFGEVYHEVPNRRIASSRQFNSGCFLASPKTMSVASIAHAVLSELFLYKRIAKLANDEQPMLNFAYDMAEMRTTNFDEADTPLATRTWYGLDFADTDDGLYDPTTSKPVALLQFAGCRTIEAIPKGPRRDLVLKYLAEGRARIAREMPAVKTTLLDRFVPSLFSTTDH